MQISLVPLGLYIVRLLSLLPNGMGLMVGQTIGYLAYLVAKERRFVCQKNLEICFPHHSKEAIKKLVQQCFKENGRGLIETSWAWHRPIGFIKPYLKYEGIELIRKTRAARQGVLLLCPHYSMLDLIAPIIYDLVGNFVISYRPNDNSNFDAAICKRRSRYAELVDVRAPREITRHLKNGDIVWFGPDQDMGPRGSVFAPFFGHLACTVTTPARLTRISSAKAIFLDVHRECLTYHVKFVDVGINYPEANEIANATRLNGLIESALALYPEQYMWMHKRFKTNPDLTRQTLYQADQSSL